MSYENTFRSLPAALKQKMPRLTRKQLDQFQIEVEERLKAISGGDRPSKWLAKNYVGGGKSELIFLDIKIPKVRSAFKEGFSFSNKPLAEQKVIWNHVWNESNVFEAMLMPLYWMSSLKSELRLKHGKLIVSWVNRVDNWAHSDELSSLCSALLEADTKAYLPIFERWARSSNSWHRRQSLVGLLYYSRGRKKHLPAETILRFVERHLDDNDYYVQKGLGWTLRECWNVYPDATLRFLKKHAAKIPPAGWYAATEKLSRGQKAALLKIRSSRKRLQERKNR
jgi:3-methyladenine DNA glycosylase AlkD